MAYSITDWRARYEVSDKGHPARDGDLLRRGRIEYIRAPVHGANWSPSFREFNAAFGQEAPAAYGVFCKLREMQADNPAEHRDCIKDHKGREMSAIDIARALGWPDKLVVKVIEVLSSDKIGWITNHDQHNTTHNITTQASGNVPSFPGTPGNSRQIRESKTAPVGAEFAEFWDAYPRKTAKGAAEKAWAKMKPDLYEVLGALEWQVESDDWVKDGGKFIPHPATYLNGKRWQDEPPAYGQDDPRYRPSDALCIEVWDEIMGRNAK